MMNRTDQLRILGCDLDHSSLAHKAKQEKYPLLAEKPFCFPLLLSLKKNPKNYKRKVFKIVRHNSYYAKDPGHDVVIGSAF